MSTCAMCGYDANDTWFCQGCGHVEDDDADDGRDPDGEYDDEMEDGEDGEDEMDAGPDS